MALSNIPVLPTDYALFDWNDWPDSFAALVSGGLTSEFEKECWNAIVNKLAKVLEDGGLPWDGKYTNAEDALIAEEYGALYADAINSIRHNIDHPIPLGWKWAKDSSFRGFVGREDFRGVDAYGADGADDVYPEYILELVRKLNLLIGIMTGENADLLSGQELSATQMQSVFQAGESAAVTSEAEIETKTEVTAKAPNAAKVQSKEDDPAKTKDEVTVKAPNAVKVQPKEDDPAKTKDEVTVKAPNAVKVQLKETGQSAKSELTLQTPKPIEVVSKESSEGSSHEVVLMSGIPVETAAESKSNTKTQETIRTGTAIPTEAASKSASQNDVIITGGQSCPAEPRGTSTSKCQTILDPVLSAPAKAEAKTNTAYAVAISTAWNPPIWVDDALWIRQAYEVVQNDDGSLEVI